MKPALIALAAIVLIGAAPSARAEPAPYPEGDDAGFLATLDQVGITYSDPGAAVTAGKTACDCLNNGDSGLKLMHDVRLQNPEMNLEAVADFILVSAKFYCPQQL